MSQAGRPAPAPGVRRASKQGPCREAGQGIKGDREEVGCGGCERPSRARGWGGPGPGPSAPPRAAGNAQQSQATRGGKVKSGRSTAFFKHTSRRCRSRKTKLSHLGERWKNTQRAWSPPPRARAGAAGPRPRPPHPQVSPPQDHGRLAPSALPSPTPAGIHGRVKDTPVQSPGGLCQEACQQPLRSGPRFPHLREEGFAVYQGLENCVSLIGIRERKLRRSKSKRLCI